MKPVAKIRTVGEMTLIAGIEMYAVTAFLSRLALQMLQQQRAQALPMRALQGYEIVNVKNMPPGHRVKKSVTSRGNDFVSFPDIDDSIALFPLLAPALYNLVF